MRARPLLALWLPFALAGCLAEGLDLGLDAGAADADALGDARGSWVDAGPPEGLDDYVEWEMAAHGISGLAATIVRDDAVVWQGTFGLADRAAEIPVTEDTLFAVGSISKTIAAVPVMRLVEDGLLDLDAPVENYLPFQVRHPRFLSGPITTRMLLTHTSGLEDSFTVLARVMDPGVPVTSLAEFSESYVTPGGALWADTNWGAQPGTRWSYCNAAFGLVGAIVEAVGGAPLPDQTREALLAPLEMIDSAWFYTEAPPELLAVGYTWNGRGYTELDHETFPYYPAGTFVSSLGELRRFLRSFIGFGSLEGVTVLSEDTARGMREPQVPALNDRQALTWRYGWIGDHRYLGHGGATLGGSAEMHFRPEDGTGIIMLTNSDAYVLARLGLRESADALDRILDRLDREAEGL